MPESSSRRWRPLTRRQHEVYGFIATRIRFQGIADKREDAAVLRRVGHEHDAKLIEGICDAVAAAAEDYLRWLSEGDAMLQSGWSPERLRRQFPAWERLGHAMYDDKGRRIYRQLIVPHRANTVAARERGRRAAMKGQE